MMYVPALSRLKVVTKGSNLPFTAQDTQMSLPFLLTPEDHLGSGS